MYVTHTVDGVDQTWEFDPRDVLSTQRVIMEKQYGGTWAEFKAGVATGQTLALMVLLCYLIRQTHPAMQLRDTPEFTERTLTVDHSPAELEETLDSWVKMGGENEPNGPMLRAMFDDQLAEAEKKYGPAPGKAPMNGGPASTSGRSRRSSVSAPGSDGS